jgi:hypothetical protein
MTTRSFTSTLARAAIVVSLSGLTACVADREKISAINAVNHSFQVEYDKIIAKEGVQVVAATPAEAFVAMRVAFAGLGLRTESQDPSIGYLLVSGAAPLPLSDAQWQRASEADLPFLREVISPHVGVAANFVKFDPQGLDVRVSATFVPAAGGTEVALTVRLQETAPARSGWPRREYVAPNVLRAGLANVWKAFDHELRSRPDPG